MPRRPAGLRWRGRWPAAGGGYVTADGKHVLVGSLFDAEGNDAAAEAVEAGRLADVRQDVEQAGSQRVGA